MIAVVIAMGVIVSLALIVTLVVAVGMQGKWRGANPEMASKMRRVAQHLNGDGEPPAALLSMVQGREPGTQH